ncbi:MAG: YbaK/EbsC family protein [Desulfurococcales archaeon]|nr:YbaK/EbsC family protein [Desulfurococcales archaeon]
MTGRDRVESWLRKHGLDWRLITMHEPTRTVAQAARQLRVDESMIIKTLILLCENNVYAVIIPGDKRLSFEKLGRIAGKCRMAKRREVEDTTGYPAGGVPPVALPENIQVIMDIGIAYMKKAYGGGGDENTLLEFNPSKLKKLIQCIVADVSQ